jgi:hypothetical protein
MARFGGKFGSPSLAGFASMVLSAVVRGVQLERLLEEMKAEIRGAGPQRGKLPQLSSRA